MVANERDVRLRRDTGAALVWLRPVPDRVSKTPDRVGLLGVHGLECSFERSEVPMNVGYDRDTHARRMRLALVCLGALVSGVAAWFLWRTTVPDIELVDVEATDVLSSVVLAEGDDYRGGTRTFWAGSTALQIVVLGLLAWRARWISGHLGRLVRGRVRAAAVFGLLAAATVWVASVPVGIARHGWRRRFDLTDQSYGGWLVDSAVNLLVTALLVALGVSVVVALAARFGSSWWLIGGVAIAACGFVFVFLHPVVVQPLLNDFTPLNNAQLEADVREIAEAVGVGVGGVEVRDQSRRTRSANARVTGLGHSRRVVIDDTLIGADAFERADIRFVVAHELAHVARSHVWKGVAWFALIVIPAAGLLALLLERARPGGASDPALVPLGLLVALLIFLATSPLQNAVSRRYEAEADWVALKATSDPEALERFMKGLVVTNIGDPTRPGWVTHLLGTHPSALERIGMARACVVGYSSSTYSSSEACSGRLRMPSRVCHFDQQSPIASMSSLMNRGETLTRVTTTPGTSPSSTS